MPSGFTEDQLTPLPLPLAHDDHLVVGRGAHLYRVDKRIAFNPAPLVAVTRPRLADFPTWLNQGSCIATDEDYGFSLYAPPRGNIDSLNARYRNVPAGSHFSVTAGVYLNAASKGNLACGIFLREATTGKLELLSIGAASNSGTATEKWDSATGGRGTRFTLAGQLTKAFLKFIVGGNWISPQISFDGVHFFQFHDPFLKRDFFSASINQWGMYVNCNNAGTPNGDVHAFMFHFEENTQPNLTFYPSYMNRFGSGPRTPEITVTTNAPMAGGPISGLVDGDYLGNFAKPYFGADTSGDRHITFGFPAPVRITEARFFMDTPSPQGTWKWQVSDNGSSWTDISPAWTLVGDYDGEIVGDLSANASAFPMYRMQQTGGSLNTAPYLRQMDFKTG